MFCVLPVTPVTYEAHCDVVVIPLPTVTLWLLQFSVFVEFHFVNSIFVTPLLLGVMLPVKE